MKRNIIYVLSLILACWACEKNQIIESIAIKSDVPGNDSINWSEVPNNDSIDWYYANIEHPQYNPDLIYGSVTDIDGNVYNTIQIGNQTWMAENLKTTRYNDGSPIYLGTGDIAGETDWFDLEIGAYCWYLNVSENKWMGAIYNWHAAASGKLAPTGWHVPNNTDWEILINYLGGEKSAHDKLLSSGKNESGFTAVPSPILCGWGFGPETSFWTATPYQHPYASVSYAYYFCIWEENSVEKISLFYDPQSYGFCVRCIKDNNP